MLKKWVAKIQSAPLDLIAKIQSDPLEVALWVASFTASALLLYIKFSGKGG